MKIVINEGFSFGCKRCGGCCHSRKGTGVQIYPVDLDKASKFLDTTYFDFVLKNCWLSINNFKFTDKKLTAIYLELDLFSSGSCVFFNNNECTIHPVKPYICRTGPISSPLLLNNDNWEKHRERCQGFDNGQYYSIKEIKMLIKKDVEFRASYFREFDKYENVFSLFGIPQIPIPTIERQYFYDSSYESYLHHPGFVKTTVQEERR